MAQDAGSLRMTTQPSNERLQVGWTKHFRRLSLVCLGGLLTAGWMIVRKSSLDWEWILEQEAVLTALTQDHFFASLAVVFIGYVLWAGLSIPGVTLVTLVVAWFFGFWVGLLLVSFASTAGATLAFLISRRLLQDWLKTRWQERWMAFDESFRRQGIWFLFSLRLMPVIPFFLINLLAGCTSMRTHTYWWISQLGMLPGTMAYVYAGSAMPSLEEISQAPVQAIMRPEWLLAFILLAALPWIARLVLQRWR